MKLARRSCRALSALALAAGLLFGGLLVVPALAGWQRYVIVSGSMTGTYDRGSLVLDDVVPVASLERGEVITYQPPPSSGVDHLVTHRIYAITTGPHGQRLFRTKGDANPVADPWTFTLGGPRQARVRIGVPYAGYAVAAVSDRRARMLLVGFPAALIALASLAGLWRESGESADADSLSGSPGSEPAVSQGADELRLAIDIPLGLHARPAARLAGLAGRFGARMTVRNESRERGPADARSLTGIATLNVRQGDEIVVTADGDDAAEALAAVRELAGEHWGDDPNAAPPPPRATADSADGAAVPAAGAATDGLLRGIPAAAGIAVGPARPLAGPRLEAPDAPAGEHEDEALDAALTAVRADLERDRAGVAARAGAAEAAIFDAHAALLADPDLLKTAHEAIAGGRSAAQAWVDAVKIAAETYRGLDDDYLRERAVDVEDVGARVLQRLTGEPAQANVGEGIVIASELTPAQAAQLDPESVHGIAGARGGATSHAAILARALGIPAVVGLGAEMLAVAPGTELVLDGDAGTVAVDPGEDALAEARARRDAQRERTARLRADAREPGQTADGARIEVFANLGAPREAAPAVEQGAEGVGLLRTEFLFLDREEPPDEDEQAAVYAEIANALGGRPLVLRTLDAGADKPLPFVRQPPEDNPFLGVRGIRLSLERPDLLRTQLKAVARVAREHPVKVMFPMVATLAEVRAAKQLVAESGAPADMEVGAMVEVPAIALQADRFARELDFFSVGTNDLTQYALAAERGNERLAALLDGPVPAVLRLIAAVVEGARAHGRWVGVCGELAGDPDAAVLLAGLGVTELSMAAGRIPQVKAALRAVELPEAQEAAARALEADDADGARGIGAALWR